MTDSDVVADRRRAGMLIDAGLAVEALRILTPILAANPGDLGALRLVAMAENRLGKHRESFDAATAATRVAPDDDLSWRLVASAASCLQLHGQAMDAAYRARAIDPSSWRNHYMLVMVAAAAKAVSPDATASARELERLAPAQADARFALGLFAGARRDWAAAEREYRRTLEMEPTRVLAQNNLAAALLNQKKLSAAAAAFTSTLGSDPTFDLARRDLLLTGREMLFRLCLLATTAPLLVSLFALSEAGVREASVRVLEGLQVVVVVVLVLLVVAQLLILIRAVGSRAGAVLRQFVRDRVFVLGAMCVLVALVLLVIALCVPPDTRTSFTDASLAVAVGGAVLVRVAERRTSAAARRAAR